MFKSERNSNENDVDIAELLCEQYLPRVFQYINYWLNDREAAEEMSLKAIKEAMARYGNYCRDERKFSTEVFVCARKEILCCLKRNNMKPVLPGLSIQEQEVISLRLAAVLNNSMISKLLGLSESRVGTIVRESLYKLRDCMEVPS
ncbi:MAG: sigma factor-like helix-turn-helix DNA-binding protein [Dehalococcoidales bacterium]|nr:sigma factor-like helix-turn-helix DNA-binding protein [Dehalococcoidales bacterium]